MLATNDLEICPFAIRRSKTLNVSGTSCAFVTGHRVAGGQPFENCVEAIDAQLVKAAADGRPR